MTDIMIDIETFGVGGNAAIVQIGAVVFGPKTAYIGAKHRRNVSLSSSILAGMDVDAKTIEWWRKQDPKAQDELSRTTVTIHDALADLSSFIAYQASEAKNAVIWSKGTDFDISILKNAYSLCGLELPWKYNAARDVRTLVYTAELLGYESTFEIWNELPHDALRDCEAQVRQVYEAFKFLDERRKNL